ncbi:MAG: 1-acyl-sn-glycerol-3-phosphate acyltransferase, partial [Pseudomonadota bacterium]
VPPPTDGKHSHIVEILIKERAQKLSKSHLWPVYRFLLNLILGYGKAKHLVDNAGRMRPKEAFAFASGLMGIKLDVKGLEHVPKEGGFILALNHPTGIADGLAAHDALAPVRPDAIVFVNGDAVRLNPLLTDKLIPVEWRSDKKSRAKSRETLRASNKAFAEGRAIVLFASGRLMWMDGKKNLHDQAWQSSVAALAKKYNVPIVPAHIRSRNSWLYYLLWNVNEELRDMTLFHELLNKQGQTFKIRMKEPIFPDALLDDNDAAAAELRAYVATGIVEGQTLEEWRMAGGDASWAPTPPPDKAKLQ